VHEAFPTLTMNGVVQMRRLLLRIGWVACVVVGLLCPGMAPQAWDAERMLAAARKLSPRAATEVQSLQPLLTQALGLDEPGQLKSVNEFFNRRVLFRDDTEVWGQVDYWASPLETLHKGQGDCEDYAVAKYFSLLALGMPSSKLRMVYVRAQIGGPQGIVQAHMVLAYYAVPGAEPMILDNLITELRPASRRPDLVPVFSFNSEGLWQGVGTQSAGDPAARLSRWRELLAKARAEGFQ
jgi:predicted transglutaminase-like cysteine proteinase